MDRRNFFRTMIGGVAAAAAVRTFPFRVYSFPSEIISANEALGFGNKPLNFSWTPNPDQAIALENVREQLQYIGVSSSAITVRHLLGVNL